MNPIRAIGRLARALAALAAATVAYAAAAPAALATPPPRPPGWNKHPPLPAGPRPALRFPPGWNKHPPLPGPARLHAAVGGLPGWQITLTAAAVLLAAALAIQLARAARSRADTRPAHTTATELTQPGPTTPRPPPTTPR